MTTSPQVSGGGLHTLGRVLLVFSVVIVGLTAAAMILGARMIRELRSVGEHAELRSALLECVGDTRRVEINIALPGWALALGRVGASLADAPDEVQVGLDAVRSGEVGVYELTDVPDAASRGALLAKADAALLEKEGWERMVTVLEKDTLVAVYTPSTGMNPGRTIDLFVIVLDQRDLVIASARGRTEPIIELAARQVDLRSRW